VVTDRNTTDGGTPAALMELSAFSPFVDGLDHPEDVTWGPDGHAYAGGEAGQVYRVGLDGSLRVLGTTGGFVLGLCLDADRNVYACDMARRAVLRMTPEGTVSEYSAGTETRRMRTPNSGVFDATGNLYVSDSGAWDGDDGIVWVVRPGGRAEILREDLRAFPNGVALDPSGEYLYVVLSQLPGVVRVRVSEGRTTGDPEVVYRQARHVPDGLAFDRDGVLYVACYAPDAILRVGPGGGVETLVEDWRRITLCMPTNVAFGGDGLTTLLVSSLGAQHLTRARVAVTGEPYHYPSIP
jgi:gluconolactonase